MLLRGTTSSKSRQRLEPYDHNAHEAISRVDAPEGIEPGQIVQMIGAGYRLHDRLIKPATVVVAQAPQVSEESSDEESAE